jgi:hypothetical protein
MAARRALLPLDVAPLTRVRLPAGNAIFSGPRVNLGAEDRDHENSASTKPVMSWWAPMSCFFRVVAQAGTSSSCRKRSIRCIETYATIKIQIEARRKLGKCVPWIKAKIWPGNAVIDSDKDPNKAIAVKA